jgi:hypothetical protein
MQEKEEKPPKKSEKASDDLSSSSLSRKPLFGYHEIPLKISQEGFSISAEPVDEIVVYRRECSQEKVDKALLVTDAQLLLNPVEPLNTPKEITPHLLIEFDKMLAVEPKARRRIFLTFPVEIGVFISTKRENENLDVFSFQRQKFTLYGDPRTGVICKYWKSGIFSTPPAADPLREGILRLTITNTSGNWTEVTKAVFNAYAMKIYYNDDMVSMKATMKILGPHMAETNFMDSPLKKNMTNSLELYIARKLAVTEPKFVMELGI